jgi:hypothetical protein
MANADDRHERTLSSTTAPTVFVAVDTELVRKLIAVCVSLSRRVDELEEQKELKR